MHQKICMVLQYRQWRRGLFFSPCKSEEVVDDCRQVGSSGTKRTFSRSLGGRPPCRPLGGEGRGARPWTARTGGGGGRRDVSDSRGGESSPGHIQSTSLMIHSLSVPSASLMTHSLSIPSASLMTHSLSIPSLMTHSAHTIIDDTLSAHTIIDDTFSVRTIIIDDTLSDRTINFIDDTLSVRTINFIDDTLSVRTINILDTLCPYHQYLWWHTLSVPSKS